MQKKKKNKKEVGRINILKCLPLDVKRNCAKPADDSFHISDTAKCYFMI
jgi:hypothetical protein